MSQPNKKNTLMLVVVLLVLGVGVALFLNSQSLPGPSALPATSSQTGAESTLTPAAQQETDGGEKPTEGADIYNAECLTPDGKLVMGVVTIKAGEEPMKQQKLAVRNPNTGALTEVEPVKISCNFIRQKPVEEAPAQDAASEGADTDAAPAQP